MSNLENLLVLLKLFHREQLQYDFSKFNNVKACCPKCISRMDLKLFKGIESLTQTQFF